MKPTITSLCLQAFWATLSIKILFGESCFIILSCQILTASLGGSSRNSASTAPVYHVTAILILEIYVHLSMTVSA